MASIPIAIGACALIVAYAMIDAAAAAPAAAAPASGDTRPWLDARRTPDERARLALAAMTPAEKYGLLHGIMAFDFKGPDGGDGKPPADAIADSAGFVPGIARLGLPALHETDASLGVANPMGVRDGDVATALPAGLVLSSSFDPELAYRAGAMVGAEARAKGYNVLLGGGMNLSRDPRNGRNFEYLGEDPWLAGTLAGAAVRGTQDQHVISTVKHFALNANETNRNTIDARIDKEALRESDLLAFEIAIERGRPGSVMCAYNQVNGDYSCDNDWLLNQVLKRDWGYPGWVMSDWGAVHGTADAAHGLDQESGEQLDAHVWFASRLEQAVHAGAVASERIDDMVRRILRAMFTVGVVDHPPVKTAIDYAAHGELALEIAHKGLVLLKNSGDTLPLTTGLHRIAVIGGHADLGVLAGGGSSQVNPANGPAVRVPIGGHGTMAAFRAALFDPSAPLPAIRAASPASEVLFDPGEHPAAAAALAAHADVAIVFATQHELEGFDVPDLHLPNGQDALIEAVAKANPHTIVVLETGNPVAMPWIDGVAAVLAAWYPGQEGGRAITDILFGAVNPSGRTSMTFPKSESDLARPVLPNLGSDDGARGRIDYTEGADVGYRYYDAHQTAPLFAFGHGLSYTRFEYDRVQAKGGRTLTVSFEVRNSGSRAGADVPQVYLTSIDGRRSLRLIGYERVELEPGAVRRVTIVADPRLLGTYDESHRLWRVAAGRYEVRVAKSAGELLGGAGATLAATSAADRP